MAAEPSLFDRFEHLGEWWLPQSPKDRLSGVLTVKHGAGRLVLMGILPSGAGLLRTRTAFVPDIIHAETGSGTQITLYRSIPVVTSFGMGPSRTEYVCSSVAIGGHFATDETFCNVAVSFTGLDAWAGHFPFVDRFAIRGRAKQPSIAAGHRIKSHAEAAQKRADTILSQV